jgi:hypothetical protein
MHVRFEVLTAMAVKITVLWDVTSRSLVDSYQRFGGICFLDLLDTRKTRAWKQVIRISGREGWWGPGPWAKR